MSVKTLRLSDISGLSEEQQRERVADFMAARYQPFNGELTAINEQLAELEKRYEVSSAAVREQVSSGTIRETAEICHWLMLLDMKAKLGHR